MPYPSPNDIRDLEPHEEINLRVKYAVKKEQDVLVDKLLDDLENSRTTILIKGTISYQGCNIYLKFINKLFGNYTTSVDDKISKNDSIILTP